MTRLNWVIDNVRVARTCEKWLICSFNHINIYGVIIVTMTSHPIAYDADLKDYFLKNSLGCIYLFIFDIFRLKSVYVYTDYRT